MRKILEPLIAAGTNGIDIPDPTGIVRKCFPILAVYPCDYPEQTLICCKRFKTSCPRCNSKEADFTKNKKGQNLDAKTTQDLLKEAGECNTDKDAYVILDEHKLILVPKPFWADFPQANIHLAMTPDILHQLYQGMVKHVIGWLQIIVSKVELDGRFKRVPSAHGLRHFPSGISVLQNASGAEHRAVAQQIMGCLIGAVSDSVLRATRGLLDFVYLAQYKSHSTETLQYLKDALTLFHENKEAFFESHGRDSEC